MRFRHTLPTAAFAILLVAPMATAQQSASAGSRVGTIIVAHGADSMWNAQVADVAKQVRTGGPIEVSYLMGAGARTARFQDAVKRLETQGVTAIVVVPMLVSSHSGHYDQIRYLAGDSIVLGDVMMHHLHMAGIERTASKLPIHVTPAMDDAPQIARVLADRAKALAPDPRTRALFIVGHGPNSAEDYAAWMKNLRSVADSVKALTGFRDVRVDLVRDDAPAEVRAEAVKRVRELIELQHLVTGQPVIVIPVLVSKGAVSRDKVPADIAGMPAVYSGEPLLPHAAIARWVEARVASAISTVDRITQRP